MMTLRMALLGLALAMFALPAAAQSEDPVEEANKGTVGIISGGVNGTYIQIASDLATVLDDGNNMRVLPIRGKGSVQNISDILYLRGIDVGIVQSDVLEFSKREGLQHPRLTNLIQYIAKLYNEEIHVLGRTDIKSLEDLRGKSVNFGISGSGTEMTASIIFESLGIEINKTSFDQALAVKKLKAGEIDGMVYVAGKPTQAFSQISADDPVHFIPIGFEPSLLETYLPARLTNEDYPALIKPGEAVDTLAVGAVMAVYNWNSDTFRYRKVSRFINAFFDRFSEFQEAPRHPKWKEVTLSAEVPGWDRFLPAQQWLDQREFEAYLLDQKSTNIAALPEQSKDAAFEEFLLWRTANAQ